MSSLFDKLGGDAAIDAAVDKFYVKVLADDRISKFFDGIDMKRLHTHQKAFLTVAFGGPNKYTASTMRAGHSRMVAMGLNDSHFDAVVENLGSTLQDMGVAEDLIKEAAGIAETVRADVLGK